MLELQPAIRYEVPSGNAHQSIWPWRQLHPENSHVIYVLIRRIHEAKTKQSDTVTIWGAGSQDRSSSIVKSWFVEVVGTKGYRGGCVSCVARCDKGEVW